MIKILYAKKIKLGNYYAYPPLLTAVHPLLCIIIPA